MSQARTRSQRRWWVWPIILVFVAAAAVLVAPCEPAKKMSIFATYYGALPLDKSHFSKLAHPAVEYVVLNPVYRTSKTTAATSYHGVFFRKNSISTSGQEKVKHDLANLSGQLAEWQQLADELTAEGKKVLGYVYTGWFGIAWNLPPDHLSIRNYRSVRDNVDHWYTYFEDHGLAGIFFDETSQYCALVGEDSEWSQIKNDPCLPTGPCNHEQLPYRGLYKHVKDSYGGIVVMNASGWWPDKSPGSADDATKTYKSRVDGASMTYAGNECYMKVSDILGVYEAGFGSYEPDPPGFPDHNPLHWVVSDASRFKSIGWAKNHPRERYLHIVHSLYSDQSKYRQVVRKAEQRNAQYVYFFDGNEFSIGDFPSEFDVTAAWMWVRWWFPTWLHSVRSELQKTLGGNP